jgi:hypothetical protein
MSKFFDSEIVRESMSELEKLQQKIMNELLYLPFFDKDKRREHLDTMREFLEKQRNLVFRISLSDDPEAVEMKEKIIESAKMFGFKETQSIDSFFQQMGESIDNLEKSLDT